MLAVAACRISRNSNGWVKPISPAAPKPRAYADQPAAARVPIEISVSIVALPCSRLSRAARWNGQAHQPTTGIVSAKEIHCHQGNCSAGTIAMMITGRLRIAEMRKRFRSDRTS